MVRLIPSHVFIKDPVDVWNKEHTIGNAELAARLGSPATFDRRGTVFAYDDFEDAPLKWLTDFDVAGGGTGQSVTLSNEYVSRGSGCMKIIPPSVAGNWSEAYRRIGGVATHRIGIEINMSFGALTVKPSIVISAFTGTRQINAGIRLQHSAVTGISYLNNTGASPLLDASYTTFDTGFPLDTDTSYPIKFVVDLDNEEYVRCMFGGTEIDMSSYTPYATDSTYCQRVNAEVYVIAGGVYPVYFNDFILTIEEPE